jgi:hypothetical protein
MMRRIDRPSQGPSGQKKRRRLSAQASTVVLATCLARKFSPPYERTPR